MTSVWCNITLFKSYCKNHARIRSYDNQYWAILSILAYGSSSRKQRDRTYAL